MDSITTSISPLKAWTSGFDLFDTEDREHDLLDRDFRPFAEECDHMQGVMMMVGTDDAWGGFGARYAERLRDELEKGMIWIWGIEDTLPSATEPRVSLCPSRHRDHLS